MSERVKFYVRRVNNMQSLFKSIKKDEIDLLEKELKDKGYEVTYDIDEDNNTFCLGTYKNNKVVIVTIAQLAEEDFYVELLGKYIALFRLYDQITGDSNE